MEKMFQLKNSTDSLISALNAADIDNYRNVWKPLETTCISPTGSKEAGRATSGIRRLKTAYRSTMTGEREENLNLIQMQSLIDSDVSKLSGIFIMNCNRRLMKNLPPSSLFKQWSNMKLYFCEQFCDFETKFLIHCPVSGKCK